MGKTWLVARREYLENVKTKTFLIGLAMMPLMMVVWMAVPAFFVRRSGPVEVTVAVLDRSGQVFSSLAERAAEYNARPNVRPRLKLEEIKPGEEKVEAVESNLARRARGREILGYLVVEPGIVEGKGGAAYAAGNLALQEAPQNLSNWLNATVAAARMRERHLDPKLIEQIRRPVPFQSAALDVKGGKQDRSREEAILAPMFTSMAFVMLLFIGVILVGQMCLNSVIEEKSNRIIEVMLASVSPHQFMVGKILGSGLMGLTLLSIWGAGGYAAAAWKGYARFVPLDALGYLLLYFVLGFLLYASTFCAIGSVCNSVKEAQNLMGPITLLLVLPVALMAPITRDPSGTLAVALTYVPFWTPFVMMNRLASSPRPGAVEIVLSILVLTAGMAAVFWAAGRIFRVGALMYGKPPRLMEILRWIRER